MATETPEYKILTRDGQFELREYPPLKTVRTAAGEGDFMRLFRYISGGNAADQKIAMTAPVLVKHGGENPGMSFIVPREVAAAEVPKPTDTAVKVDTLRSGRFAVYRYSGRRNETNESKALAELQMWAGKRHFAVAGEPVFAYYDPPWVLPFLRRNEVMLPIAGTKP